MLINISYPYVTKIWEKSLVKEVNEGTALDKTE
jgi:hypothetical protein